MSASRPADQLYRRDIVHVHLALSLQTSGGGRSAHSGRKKLRKNSLPRATLKGHAGCGKMSRRAWGAATRAKEGV
jgi:hypothetical protein